MSDALLHPTPDRLEAFVEGSLADGERAVLESHLLGCTRCQAEVEEWRALFSVLAELPQFSPAPGFADRVMAGVRLPQPWHVRAAAQVERWAPKTTRGWALVAAFGSLPMLVFGALAAWLLSQPSVSVGSLLTFAKLRTTEFLAAALTRLAEMVLTSETTLWLANLLKSAAASLSAEQIGAAAALFAVMSVLSGWVLYRYLFQTKTRETNYVSYSF